MGRSGKKSVLAFFGFKKQAQHREEEAGRQSYQILSTRVRPSDEDYGRHWYGDRDIDRKAREYIERVHRGMVAHADQDG